MDLEVVAVVGGQRAGQHVVRRSLDVTEDALQSDIVVHRPLGDVVCKPRHGGDEVRPRYACRV